MRRDDMKEDWSSGAKRKLRDIEIMSSCANYIHITNSFSPILSSCFLSYLITFSLIFSSPLSSSLLCSLFMIPSASSQFHFLSFLLSCFFFSSLLFSPLSCLCRLPMVVEIAPDIRVNRSVRVSLLHRYVLTNSNKYTVSHIISSSLALPLKDGVRDCSRT